jgi:hypothetical protein
MTELPTRTASSASLTVIAASTGPKISSRAMRISWRTSPKIVGST